MVAHAAQQGMDYVIVRPTAYFKDFTSFPLRKMQVGAASAPAELSCFCALSGWRCGIGAVILRPARLVAAIARQLGRWSPLPPAAPGAIRPAPHSQHGLRVPCSPYRTVLHCTALQEGTTMTLIGEGRARYNAIDGAELAEVMADLIQHPDRITERQLK